MTDKQDPITHAARLLREAAEELRQAHTYHRSEGWQGETGAQSAYDVYMAAAQALEDWEAAVGAGGVQALSAAPAGWRELAAKVMDALADAQDTTNSQYPEHVRCYPSWERHARWLRWHADMFRSGNPVGNGAGNPDVLAALAASSTPPAEQQAQPGAVYAELPEPTTHQIAELKACEHGDAIVGWRVEPSRQSFHASMHPKRTLYTTEQARNFADRTHALRMQAAPKAAPGEPSYSEKWDAELGRTAMRFVDRAGDVHPGIDDAETICAEFYKAMSEVIERMPHVQRMTPPKAAPVEPVGMPSDKLAELHEGLAAAMQDGPARNLHIETAAALRKAAPQPAPAPLSDDAKDAARYRWLRTQDNEEFEFAVVKNPHFDVFDSPEELDAAIDAALAAQKGTP